MHCFPGTFSETMKIYYSLDPLTIIILILAGEGLGCTPLLKNKLARWRWGGVGWGWVFAPICNI